MRLSDSVRRKSSEHQSWFSWETGDEEGPQEGRRSGVHLSQKMFEQRFWGRNRCSPGRAYREGKATRAYKEEKPAGKKSAASGNVRRLGEPLYFEKTPQLAVIKRAKEGRRGVKTIYGTESKTPYMWCYCIFIYFAGENKIVKTSVSTCV